MDNFFAPCPCGSTPKKLIVYSENGGDKPKWAHCYGDCCGAWEIEFRNNWKEVGTKESYDMARDAWNSAPRGTKQ